MRYTKLNTGEKIVRIWQGGARVRHVDIDDQVKTYEIGLENGLNTIDTAECYGDGRSEIIVSKLLKKINRKDIFISSKVSAKNLHYTDIIKSCEASLKRLNTDYIDLYQLHWGNPLITFEESAKAFKKLKEDGKIKNIGICNLNLNQIKKFDMILDSDLVSIQMEYNLFDRSCEYNGIIQYCQNNNLIFAAYSPKQGKFNNNRVISILAKKYNKTNSQIILAWMLSMDKIIVITKSNNPFHIKENAEAMDFILDTDSIMFMDKEFTSPIIEINPREITCKITGGNEEGNQPAYENIEEAIENKFNYIPSPMELSKEVIENVMLSKPIYINRNKELRGGNVRYWAWVLAFGFDKKIECIIVNK